MSENETTGGNNEQVTPPVNGENTEENTEFEPITSQDDLNKIISDRLARERKKFSDYDDLKAKAAKFDEVEEAQKTELEKVQERLAQAEAKAAEAELKALRADVATSKAVPAGLLQGSTKEELEASAKALLEFRDAAVKEKSRGVHNRLFGQPPTSSKSDDGQAVARNLFQPE